MSPTDVNVVGDIAYRFGNIDTRYRVWPTRYRLIRRYVAFQMRNRFTQHYGLGLQATGSGQKRTNRPEANIVKVFLYAASC